MTEDKTFRGEYDDLSDPIRQLCEYGDYWGVAVDKLPHTPTRWKKDRSLLMSYHRAVAVRDALEADGKNAVLYYVIANTNVRPLDFDPDKETGQLRDIQVKTIQYYKDEVKAPIAISSSGVGRHVYVLDPNGKLPVIGPNYVTKGLSPCEIKHEVIFISGVWEQQCPIPVVDQKSIDRFNEIVKPTTTRTSTSVPKEKTKKRTIRQTKKALAQLRAAITWADDEGITDIVHDNATFSCFALGAQQIGLPLDERIDFCLSQDGDKTNVEARLRSTNTKEDDQRRSCLSLFRKKGWNDSTDKKPPDGKIAVPSDLTRTDSFVYCLTKLGIEVRNNELVGTEVKLPNEGWRELDDKTMTIIAVEHVGRKCVRKANLGWVGYEVDDKTMLKAYEYLEAKREPYNETREWLKTIPAKKDEEAIDQYLSCYKIDGYGRLADAGYTKDRIKIYYRTGAILMMATWILRSLIPGCLWEKLVVLIGETGCGKGLGLKLQLPPLGRNPINGEIIPNKAHREQCRVCDSRSAWFHNRQCSLGEVTELVGFTRPGNEKLKAILSATTDVVEPKYINKKVTVPKSYGLVGTTNDLNFKPADGAGDRRTFIMDYGYAWDGGKKVTSEKIPDILNDEWRRRAVGHVKWLIENGYRGDIKDWDDVTEEMRMMLVSDSSKHYPRIEEALKAVAYGSVDYYDMLTEKSDGYSGRTIEQIKVTKPKWKFYKYHDLIDNTHGWMPILRHGLPFSPAGYPDQMPTWMRLLTLYDDKLTDKYNATTIKMVATQHLGWKWHPEPKSSHNLKRCRGWLIPDPNHGE